MLQTGRTNFGALNIGSYGDGSYSLANGVLVISGIGVDYLGSFNPWGGSATVTGAFSTRQVFIAAGYTSFGFVRLSGGTFSAAAMAYWPGRTAFCSAAAN